MTKSIVAKTILIFSIMIITGVPAQAQNQAVVNQPQYGQTEQPQIIYPSNNQVQPGLVQQGQPLAVYPPSGQMQPGQMQPGMVQQGQPLAVYPPSGQMQPGQMQPGMVQQGQPLAVYPPAGQMQPGQMQPAQTQPSQVATGPSQAAPAPAGQPQPGVNQPAPAGDNPVVIYGKKDCPSTTAARKAHPNHIFLDLDEDPSRLQEVQSLTGGERVWPVIIMNQHIIIGWKGGVCGEQPPQPQ